MTAHRMKMKVLELQKVKKDTMPLCWQQKSRVVRRIQPDSAHCGFTPQQFTSVSIWVWKERGRKREGFGIRDLGEVKRGAEVGATVTTTRTRAHNNLRSIIRDFTGRADSISTRGSGERMAVLGNKSPPKDSHSLAWDEGESTGWVKGNTVEMQF